MEALCCIPRLSLFLPVNLLILLTHLNQIAFADSEASQVFVYALCTDTDILAPNSVYRENINATLSYLASNSSGNSRVYNTTIGHGGDKVYGLYFCRLDVTNNMCQQCISPATDEMRNRCPGQKVAVLWYSDNCMVRYSNEPFLGTMQVTPMVPMWNRQKFLDILNVTTNMTGFMQVLVNTLGEAVDKATSGLVDKRLATREGIIPDNLNKLNTIYTLVECTPDITLGDCKHCLKAAIGNISELCNVKAGCTLMCLNCNIRYDTTPFYGDFQRDTNGPSAVPIVGVVGTGRRGSRNKRTLLIGILTAAAVMTVITIGFLNFVWNRKTKKSHNDSNDYDIVDNLKFDFSQIRSATNNFSNDQKLGEGGFGEVFKGKLHSGQEIAVKRLAKNSKQGAKEFKTEVCIVAKLQHKNLANLLGFCLAKQEKLLIYEFCSNLSLDQLLFDPVKCLSLDWNTRFKIICGIARGLLYLHEDSRLKIIHRDLKASNVLLDNDMNPKISDFGMARLFGADETQRNTNKIAGTLGYMAPEYVIAGHYSVKSDAYSFGIIVLEIVSGQRHKFVRIDHDEESVLDRAWRLWNEELAVELIDKTMKNNVSNEEAIKCIHIGLLCVQEDAAKRPRMTSIVSALNGDAIDLPSPTPPHRYMPGPFGINEQMTDQSGNTFTGSKTITVLDAR